ncbi:MAG: hypothetical protein ACRD4R_14325 [Candidatus Acidiferrales bacterium]
MQDHFPDSYDYSRVFTSHGSRNQFKIELRFCALKIAANVTNSAKGKQSFN